jgi:thioredoxin 1
MNEETLAVFDAENFDRNVLNHKGLVLVDFWSEGCVPCRQLSRILAQLRAEVGPDVAIGAVKVNDNPTLSERYAVRSSPTLLFFKDGAVVETRTGVDRRQVLKKLVEDHK